LALINRRERQLLISRYCGTYLCGKVP